MTREEIELQRQTPIYELDLTVRSANLLDNYLATVRLNELNDKVKELEQELAELKEKAIVPKFNVGQECYLIDNNFNYFKDTKEFNIVRSKIKKQQNWYYIQDYGIYHEEDLFATEQEALNKLKEIQGNE